MVQLNWWDIMCFARFQVLFLLCCISVVLNLIGELIAFYKLRSSWRNGVVN